MKAPEKVQVSFDAIEKAFEEFWSENQEYNHKTTAYLAFMKGASVACDEVRKLMGARDE